MNKRFFLCWLAGCCLLYPAPLLFATEQPAKQPPAGGGQVSIEDLEVIALMELLQRMDMLKDFDIVTAGEEEK